jgi:hypothetical protein
MTPRPQRRVPPADLACLAALACLLVLPSLVRGDLIGGGELTHHFYRLLFVARQIRSGHVPLWNPYLASGYPAVADPPTGFFYPLTVPLLAVLSVQDAINTGILVHLVLAGAFMDLYLLGLGLTRPARLVGAAVYMLAGYTATRLMAGDIQRVQVYAWTPLLLYLIDEITDGRRRVGAALLGGVVLASQFLAGDPQTFVYSTMAVAAYAASRVMKVRGQGGVRAGAIVVILLFMFGVAAPLAAVQYLPSSQALALANRSSAEPDFPFIGSIPPVGLVSLVAPLFFGNEHTNWGESLEREFYFHSSTLYVGFFTLALIAAGIVTRWDRWHVRFFAFFGLGVLWIALGKYGLVYRAVQYVPILRDLKNIEDINTLVPLSAAVLAGVGFDVFRTRDTAPALWPRTFKILVRCLGAAVVLAAATLLGHRGILNDAEIRARLVPAVEGSAAFAFVMLGISFGLLRLRARRPTGSTRIAVAAAAFIIVDLLGFALPLVNTGTDLRSSAADEAVERYLERDRSDYRVYGLGGRAVAAEVQEVQGEVGLLSARYSEYTNFIQGYPIWNFSNRPAGPHGVLLRGNFDSPLLSLLDVKYVVDRSGTLPPLAAPWLPTEVAPGATVYRNTAVVPRAIRSENYRVLTDRLAILRALSRPGYDPRRFVILEQQPAAGPTLGRGTQPTDPASRITITAYRPDYVALHVVFGSAGFLVLNDLYYPAWRASVDGRSTPVYRANYMFRAVVVPAGTHTVIFAYHDRRLVIGGLVSGGTLLVGVLVWCVDRRRGRARTRGSSGQTPRVPAGDA